jgi:hypothetical protein
MTIDYDEIERQLVLPEPDVPRMREYALALLREARRLDDELDAKHAKLVEVADKLRAERARADALVASLPICDYWYGEAGRGVCGRPATRALGRGGERFCDEHGEGVPEYPRAEPIRAILAARKALAPEREPQ